MAIKRERCNLGNDLFAYACFALAGINVIAWLRNDLNGDAGEDFGEMMSAERFERGSD
uniref:hypothetical protein n=1 Tax=uncultured Altererythrobacter sp. TaxID=500840 RepID=UPI0026085168|nr:hypothetical protein [uncultured Altererythrobacter sp.]